MSDSKRLPEQHDGDHVFTDWEFFEGWERHWTRHCMIHKCTWRQFSSTDPASTDPVDRALSQLAGHSTSETMVPLRIDLEALLPKLPADDYLRVAVEAQVALMKVREYPGTGRDRIDYLAAMQALTRIVTRELGRRQDLASG